MSEQPTLLVVDDEQVICEACRRIFSRQGFQVEATTDPRQGLTLAVERPYAAILLDIKMPAMDGIQFLERLREKKLDIPVLIMTGYPSVPNAAAAIRLGASDYITKPFTPEEITQAVQRVFQQSGQADSQDNGKTEPQPPPDETQTCLFFGQSWLRLEPDGSAMTGAVLPVVHGKQRQLQQIRLPGIGEVVYQGLPLAAVYLREEAPVVVLSPVSGVVAAVNEALLRDPAPLVTDPCASGWIACICTTRAEEELENCRPRRVLLFSTDQGAVRKQTERLRSLGCCVETSPSLEAVDLAKQPEETVLLLDAASYGEAGPDMVAQVNHTAPRLRIVVLATADGKWESEYRKQRIFYYAVEPFADGEIVEILDAAFQPHDSQRHCPQERFKKALSEALSGIGITNRNGHKVYLLAAPGLLRRCEGLGGQIRQKLIEKMFPVVATPGDVPLTPSNLLKMAGQYDRLMVLSAKDSGRLPGTLARDTKAEIAAPGEGAVRITTLEVQPDAVGSLDGLDERVTEALAEHIVREMASY